MPKYFILEKAAAYGYNSLLGCPVTEGRRPLFLEAYESDCNGYVQDQIDREVLRAYNSIGL